MITTSFRLLITGALLAVATLTAPLAKAECGKCGDKKECPSPTPVPSPAK